MSGMFWHNNYSPSIKISIMLHEKEITLKKLMDDDNILQECRAQNKKLLKFLTRSDVLEELVTLIIEEPSEDTDERWRYKYSNIACELLTCEVSLLTEKLAGNEMLMSKLYSFIDTEQSLNPLLASFFSKTLHTLLRRTSYQNWFSYQFACLQVLESFKNHENWIDLLLQHIQTSAIMDFILILITKIESHEISLNISNWLDDQQLIQRLIKLLSPVSDSEKHTNVSQLLSDIVKSSRLEGENRTYPIYQTLQSEETIKLILETIMSGEKIESSIIGGIRILISIMGQRESNESYKVLFNNIVEDEKRYNFAMIIIPYLDKLNLLLLDPPEKPSIKTTAGILEKPFGSCRLHILKLYVSLFSTKHSKVLEKFAEFNTFQILLDLFFQFTWNNFLHTQVQQCLSLAICCNLPNETEIIFFHVFVKNKLIDRILKAWENNDQNSSNQQNGIRQGYMGHLIIIANDVVAQSEENSTLLKYLKANLSDDTIKQWHKFVTTKLDEINKIQELILGESSEGCGSSNGNQSECPPFQDLYNVEPNAEYQERSPLTVYVDKDYQFQMEKFNDEENTFKNSVNEYYHQTLQLPDDEFEDKQKLFDQICSEKQFDDIRNNINWETEDDFSKNKSELTKRKHNNSSSSDEDNDDNPRDLCKKMDVIDPWIDKTPLPKSETASIKFWNNEFPKPVEETGWATFDDFSVASNTNFDATSSDYSSNENKMELSKVPNFDETISLLKTANISNSNYTKDTQYINKQEDEFDIKVADKIDCTEISKNISDSNANVAFIKNR